MRNRTGLATIVVMTALFGPVAAQTPTTAVDALKTTPVDALSWMTGCWERTVDDFVIEERWMHPRWGAILGLSQTIEAGETIGYELMKIETTATGVVFYADLLGQDPVEFTATNLSTDSASFENTERDVPRRITYTRADADALVAQIDDGAPGEPIELTYHRFTCEAE